MSDLLDRVRSTCTAVARRASRVRVREDRLDAYAASLDRERLARPEPDVQALALDDERHRLAFCFTLDAVNFGSGWFPFLRKDPGRSGYRTLSAALLERFLDRGPLPAAELRSMDGARCAELFRQPLDGGPREELMNLFARAWADLGAFLEGHGGSFEALAASAGGSAARLAETLRAMPLYRDEAVHAGETVCFYKRAQLTAADLHLAFGGRGPGRFEDLHRLTLFADNLVPHVLWLDGVLAYDPGLVARIEAGELLANGSEEEVEIRACAVAAVEALVARMAPGDRRCTAMALDNLLWHRGQGPSYKARPRHRARCAYY